MTIIPLAPPSLAESSNLPGSAGRAVRSGLRRVLPYLVLLRAGFCLPPVLPRARCALTAPFHPYPLSRAVYFLCHFPSGCPDRALPGALPCGVRTFLPPSRPAGATKGDRLAHCEHSIVAAAGNRVARVHFPSDHAK